VLNDGHWIESLGRHGIDEVYNIHNVNGSDWDDLIIGHGIDEVYNIHNVNGSEWDDLIIGDDGDNQLSGGLGNDTLIGGLGSDVLIGGDGADRFEYRTPEEGGDTIVDFVVSEDVLVIDADAFGGGLSPGSLPDFQFVSGESPEATDPEWGQFLYDTSSGDLYWDSDGAGEGGAVLIATFDDPDNPEYQPPALTAADFEIVGSDFIIGSFGDIAAAVDAGSEPVA
jgi:Ca2+-binding RTX toxin-like protein